MPAMIFNTIVEGVYLVVVLNSFSELEPSGEIETGIYNVVSFTFFSVFPKLFFIFYLPAFASTFRGGAWVFVLFLGGCFYYECVCFYSGQLFISAMYILSPVDH